MVTKININSNPYPPPHPLLPLLPPPPPPNPTLLSFLPFWGGGRRGRGCGREVGGVWGKRLVANQIGQISLYPCLTALLGLKASGLTDWVTDLLDHRLTVTPLIHTLLLHTPPLRPLLPPPPPTLLSSLPSHFRGEVGEVLAYWLKDLQANKAYRLTDLQVNKAYRLSGFTG